MTEIRNTREAWLHRAIDALRPRFTEVGMPIPETLHVSVGFGFGAKAESATVLGECWAKRASEDMVNHIFISPIMGDTARVLDVLVHELIHAADDCKSGHKGAFAEAATRLGLEGPMMATKASIVLAADLMTLAETLGDYPHGVLTAAMKTTAPRVPVPAGSIPEGRISSGPRKQEARMLKVLCPCCGYTMRVANKWLEVGMPRCPSGTETIRG